MPDQMREALSAAYDKHEAEEVEVPTAVVDAPEPVDSTPAPEAAPPSEKDAGVETPPEVGSTPPPVAAPVVPAAQTAAPVVAAKPPRAWSAEAKAAFATLPEPVKQDVLRREKEISQGLELAAPARKHYEAFNEVVKPFQPLFDAYGISDPLPTMRELLTARATLEIGTTEQKAGFLANLIHEFGVDVDVLANVLESRGPIQPFRPARPAPKADYRADPALAPLFAIAEQVQQATVAKAEAAIEKAATLPHFEELREDMADIIERYQAQGKTISIEDAHRRALAMNPNLEPAVPAVPQITKSQAAAILASRNAASSVAGAPRTGAKATPTDRRDQIAAAWDNAR